MRVAYSLTEGLLVVLGEPDTERGGVAVVRGDCEAMEAVGCGDAEPEMVDQADADAIGDADPDCVGSIEGVTAYETETDPLGCMDSDASVEAEIETLVERL